MVAKKNWLDSTISVLKDAENINVIAKDFQEQAISEVKAEITGLESELIRKKQAQKRAVEAYEKSAFTITTGNDIGAYLRNRDKIYSEMTLANVNVEVIEKTMVRRREQLKDLE